MDSEKRKESLRRRPFHLIPLQRNPDFQRKPTAKDRLTPLIIVNTENGMSGDKAYISAKPDSQSQCNSVNERHPLKEKTDEAATASTHSIDSDCIPIYSRTDCISGCTKASGKTEQQMKDVNQGDNLSCHSFNEADFQSGRTCDSVEDSSELTKTPEKKTPASVQTAINPDKLQRHRLVPLSVSALQTAWVPVEVYPPFLHGEREKQDQEAQWTRAREETQSMVRRNLAILEKELLASFGRISEDLATRKHLKELSRPDAKSQRRSRLGGCLRRLRIKLMGRRKEREDYEELERTGPEVKALLLMAQRNGSNADLHVEEQEKWDSDVDRLSEDCRTCSEQMMESLQELLSTLHSNQYSKAERKPSTQSFTPGRVYEPWSSKSGLSPLVTSMPQSHLTVPEPSPVVPSFWHKVSGSLAPPTLVVPFTDNNVTRSQPPAPPVALVPVENVRQCPIPPTFVAPFTINDIPGTPSQSETPPAVKLRPPRPNTIITVSSNTRKLLAEGPDEAREEGDGKKKKKKVKTRKQKGEKEIQSQQVEHSNCPQVEESDSQRAGDSQGQSLKKRFDRWLLSTRCTSN
ncbi:uncharacterized protein LOC134039422 [Osmerus eperlanus]|uniref:uncharacterized protein LOC134039422 n=1 Tax=Osmerus eperlanus TaxID=29151 RepID=UPI002E111284